MNDYLSAKFKVLSALLILMVIYIHSYYSEGTDYALLLFIENVLGGGLCSVAVPLFYIISGYLFFLKVPNGLKSIGEKLKKRCHTLLIPYIIANLFTFAFYVLLNIIAWKVNTINNVVNFRVLDAVVNEGFFSTFRLIFITPPIAFHLWFVRDLMVVMLFSPLIYRLIKRLTLFSYGQMTAIVILVAGLIFCGHQPFASAALWFTLGAVLSTNSLLIRRFTNSCVWMCTACCFVYIVLSIADGLGMLPEIVGRIIPLFGVPAVWLLYDSVFCPSCNPVGNKYVCFLTSYTFFVYLCHEPLLNIFKKLPLLVSRSEPTLIAAYLFIPPLFYVIACGGGYLAKHILPKVYALYTGGR